MNQLFSNNDIISSNFSPIESLQIIIPFNGFIASSARPVKNMADADWGRKQISGLKLPDFAGYVIKTSYTCFLAFGNPKL